MICQHVTAHASELCFAVVLQVFADYKTRGPVILKPSDTTELIEKLEDSQMQLGSMATNRWGGALDYGCCVRHQFVVSGCVSPLQQ
jgi:hypothetical protein